MTQPDLFSPTQMHPPPKPEPVPMVFDGSNYVKKLDQKRLTGQVKRVFNKMRDGNWRTLSEISEATGDPEASISAQLRHLRKERFGSHRIDKKRRGDRKDGLFEYRLVVNTDAKHLSEDKPRGASEIV